MHLIVRRGDSVEPWDGGREYREGALCTHKGKTWRCTLSAIYNSSFEPGGFAPYGWELVGE